MYTFIELFKEYLRTFNNSMEILFMKLAWIYRLLILILVVVIFYVLYLLSPIWQKLLHLLWLILFPFLLAAFISYLLHPVVTFLQRFRLKKWTAIVIVYLVLFFFLCWGSYQGIPLLIKQIKASVNETTKLQLLYNSWLTTVDKTCSHLPFGLEKQFLRLFSYYELKNEKQIYYYGKHMFGSMDYLFSLSLVPFISFYFLRDNERIGNFLLNKLTVSVRETMRRFLIDCHRSLGGYLRGQSLLCLFVGLSSYVVYIIFDLPYALFLGVTIGILNIIPTFGAIIGAIPALLVSLSVSKGVFFQVLIALVVIQMFEGNYLSPIVLGKSINLPALVVILALVVGEVCWGFWGLIFSVPLFSFLKILWVHGKQFFKYHVKSKK